ncbi:glutamate-ammonia-ligase adenylyltransferase [Escherichia coli]|nr:glutamate-ammonia-ligase adenylyltransferase [Escherichia coli]
MKPLSSPLQQYWQTVVERLPEPLAEESLSAQAKSVLTFSDFVQDSVIAHPEWLTELGKPTAAGRRMAALRGMVAGGAL